MREPPVRYLTPMFDVEMIGDVEFGASRAVSGEMETLRLDIYQPAGDKAPLRPAILWFHGGGFRPGNDKRQVYIPRFAKAFAARGYVGIAPDYRVRANPDANWGGTVADAIADARMALEWVRAHTADYRIDPSRIALAGGSAGGMIVVSLMHGPDAPTGVWALLDLWGTPGTSFRQFSGVSPSAPPTFIVHGTADALVPYEWSAQFAAELAQAGVPHQLLTLEGAPHTPLAHMEQMVAAIAAFLAKLL